MTQIALLKPGTFDAKADRPAADRATLEGSTPPAVALTISHLVDGGDTVRYRYDPLGTALATADGRNWSPDGNVTLQHFGAAGDGVADDTGAVKTAVAWVSSLANDIIRKINAPAGVYRLTERIDMVEDFLWIDGEVMGRAAGSTTNFRGATTFVYDGPALGVDEGVFHMGAATDQMIGGSLTNMSIHCKGNANAVYGFRANMLQMKNLYIDQPLTGIKLGTLAYSSTIDNVEVYDPVTGGMDLTDSCHSVTISNCRHNNSSGGTNAPEFGTRIASVGNCSNVVIIGSSYDYYRVGRFVDLIQDCKGFTFIGNYLECKGDGVTGGAIRIGGGCGIIHSNRITKANSPVVTAINYGIDFLSTSEGFSVIGNYFSGFDVAAVVMRNGAHNISTGPNELSGLTHVVNQNADGSKSHTEVNDGKLLVQRATASSLVIPPSTTLTISGGAVTILGSNHTLDTEGAAATDDLDTINGGTDGQILILRQFANSRVVTIKDATGNIQLSTDFSMANARSPIMLQYASGFWHQIARSSN